MTARLNYDDPRAGYLRVCHTPILPILQSHTPMGPWKFIPVQRCQFKGFVAFHLNSGVAQDGQFVEVISIDFIPSVSGAVPLRLFVRQVCTAFAWSTVRGRGDEVREIVGLKSVCVEVEVGVENVNKELSQQCIVCLRAMPKSDMQTK